MNKWDSALLSISYAFWGALPGFFVLFYSGMLDFGFVSYYILLLFLEKPAHFLMRDRSGVEPYMRGRGEGQEAEGLEGGETIIKIY